MEFDWTEYLEAKKSIAVPEEIFSHVEASVTNGIKRGMLMEVAHKSSPPVYWIADISLVCGHLLRARYIGTHQDFWCDIATTKVHPLGWCGKYDELIEPPEEVNQKYGDSIIDIMKNALLNGQSVSIEALNNKGLSPIDRIKTGMKVEVQNLLDPYRYWIATICENVGGRLLLRYDGSDDDLPRIWLFCTNPRLSNFGYVTNKGSPWQFKYPGKVNKFSCKTKLSAQLRQSAEEAITEPSPSDLFQPIQTLEAHNFVAGMKLEALDPCDMKSIRPATVNKVFNNLHFLVTVDDHAEDYEDTKMAWLCDSLHPYIYPIGWAERNKVPFTNPNIWKEGPFDWDEYLTMTSSVPAPDYCFADRKPVKDLLIGMNLEAVNPLNHEEIHVASILNIAEHMLCIELVTIGEKFWFSQDSDLLFPVGWSDSNNYELHIPDMKLIKEQAKEEKEKMEKMDLKKEEKLSTEEWCEKIYFNYKCYSGPSISRNKLSQLPKHVGPGPLSLVLKEVMNKIISASYKPAKLLKDWETEGPPEDGMRLEMLRAKLKTSTYHAYVPIATSLSQVPNFCRDVCVKLQACPSLFGPNEYTSVGQCPNRCQHVDKSTFHTSVDRRGRPKGSFSKRRRRKALDKQKQASQETESNKDDQSNASDHEHDQSAGSTPPSEPGTRPTTPDSDYKRPKRETYPKLAVKTRGAKLPNFAQQIKDAHWDKKNVQNIYNNINNTTSRVKKRNDSESETSSNSRKNISDVSDSEEPELKKLKFKTYDPLPTENKMFQNSDFTWIKSKLNLAANPLDWSVDDVYSYLTNTDDCKLIADRMKQEQIDGLALIMLDLHTIEAFLHMKKEFALQLCRHISMIRCYYDVNFDGE